MIAIARDIVILVCICLASGVLCGTRLHDRQLEQNRAEVIYTVDVDNAVARELMASLEKHGFLNGVPRTYWIGKTLDIYELRVVTNPSVIADPRVEALLREGFRRVCQAAFPGEHAMVKLANTRLDTFRLLVEPQMF